MFSVDEDEFQNLPELNGFKRNAIRLTEISVGLTVLFVGFTFPLVLVDAYLGITSVGMLLYGSIGMAAFLVLYAVILWFVNARLIRNGVYVLSEKEAQAYHYNHKLQKNHAIILVTLVVVTAFVQEVATSIWGPYSIMKGTTFEDYDSFVAYMEQDIPYEERYYSGSNSSPNETVSVPAPENDETWFDQFGNEISEEEARRRTVEDRNGNVLCEYIDRNEMVCSIRFGTGEDMLPITVSTYDDLDQARQTVAIRNVFFGIVYCVEAAGVLLTYILKRKK